MFRSRSRLFAGVVLLLLVLGPTVGFAGESFSDSTLVLSGTVRDAKTGEPLSAANVFVAGTTYGTATDRSGYFRLSGVPVGARTLVVSHLGYARIRRDTLLGPGTHRFRFALDPVVIELPNLSVRPRGETWRERLRRFERSFLGPSQNADRTELLNPEVLTFKNSFWGPFTAKAHRPIEFENRALGYRVRYHLSTFRERGGTIRFDGEAFFTELEPRDSTEARRWRRNRRRTYLGSLDHFLRAAVQGRAREEGFRIYIQPDRHRSASSGSGYPIDPSEFFEADSSGLACEMEFAGRLNVIYEREPESEAYLDWRGMIRAPRRSQHSWIELTDGPVHVDESGEVVEPFGLTVYGYFAFERAAEILPESYRPPDTTRASSVSARPAPKTSTRSEC